MPRIKSQGCCEGSDPETGFLAMLCSRSDVNESDSILAVVGILVGDEGVGFFEAVFFH